MIEPKSNAASRQFGPNCAQSHTSACDAARPRAGGEHERRSTSTSSTACPIPRRALAATSAQRAGFDGPVTHEGTVLNCWRHGVLIAHLRGASSVRRRPSHALLDRRGGADRRSREPRKPPSPLLGAVPLTSSVARRVRRPGRRSLRHGLRIAAALSQAIAHLRTEAADGSVLRLPLDALAPLPLRRGSLPPPCGSSPASSRPGASTSATTSARSSSTSTSRTQGEAIYCIVDLHATTVAVRPGRAARAALRHGRDPARRRARPGALRSSSARATCPSTRELAGCCLASPRSATSTACTSSRRSPARSATSRPPGSSPTRC